MPDLDKISNGSLVMNFFLVIFSSELLSNDFWYGDRQTDGKRCIIAHRALAQVGSKM